MGTIRSGAVIGGKYRLEAPLGQGGMGAVWAARHLALDTVFAVKFISPGAPDFADAKRRFEREAKVAALLKSPHVVEVHDYGVEGDTPYIVMELLLGEDLASRLARRGRLSLEETVDIVTQVARALRRAAEASIVHRDLKPGNIFLVHTGDDGELVKVLDFGAAKAPRLASLDDATKAGILIGSPRYMSPEQARASRKVDHRSDLWSLAVIVYRALTGRLPFLGDDIGEVIVRVCTEAPPRPSLFVPELGPEIDAFFARALQRDPALRFQTARALADALAEAAGIVPASSRSVPRLALNDLALPPPSRRVDPTPKIDPSREIEPTRSVDPEPDHHSESTPGGTSLNRPAPRESPFTRLRLLRAPWRAHRRIVGVCVSLLLAAAALSTWRALRRSAEPAVEVPAPTTAARSALIEPVASPAANTVAPSAASAVPEPPPDAGAAPPPAAVEAAPPAPAQAPSRKRLPSKKNEILGI